MFLNTSLPPLAVQEAVRTLYQLRVGGASATHSVNPLPALRQAVPEGYELSFEKDESHLSDVCWKFDVPLLDGTTGWVFLDAI